MKQTLESYDKLRDYQKEGVNFFLKRDHALLADEMGLGKSIQTILALEMLIKTQQCKRIIIICPTSLTLNWEDEIKKWTTSVVFRRVFGDFDNRKAYYNLPITVLIASYEQIRSDIDYIYCNCNFDLVVLDEIQRIKNSDSSLALSCRQIKRKRSWGLSGTPLENHPDDLYSIFAFLKPGLLSKGEYLQEMKMKISPYTLRRSKKDVLPELPPIIFHNIYLELSSFQQHSYDETYYADYLNTEKPYTFTNLLAAITKLKQICNFDPRTDESIKMQYLFELVQSVEERNDKILVFSQYVDTLEKIKNRFVDPNIEILHGALSKEDRARMVNDFEKSTGKRIFLISLRAGGVGINLNSANLVVLFDLWWNPAIELQAVNRAHRFGKKNPLIVKRLIVKNTIEEKIDDILLNKKTLFNDLMSGLGNDTISHLGIEDLMKILN